MSPLVSLLCLILPLLSHNVLAQTPSAGMKIPPLQWIKLSNLSGSSPVALRDSAIGYEDSSRTIILFGGQSASQAVTQSTSLLNLDSMAWSQPKPSLSTLTQLPPPRSKALAGVDFAANSRTAFAIFGGMGNDQQPLDDIWEYSFLDQFWQQVNASGAGPSARWSAAGGSDLTQSIRNPNPPTTNNIFYLFGGSSSDDIFPDAWHLTLGGTLSPNNLNQVTATWNKINPTSSFLVSTGAASGVLPGGTVVIYGGCNETHSATFNGTCALQSASVITSTNQITTPGRCPTPRFGASMTPNYNSALQSFGTQMYLLFGSFDPFQWDDSGGLKRGEVAVLDTTSGTWVRVLAAGEPPSPREGAAVLSFPSGLVGDHRAAYTDTFVFGGQDLETGVMLDDAWILRAYAGSVDSTNTRWTGFGDGQLNTGINADGQGVEMTFISECASTINSRTTSTSSQPHQTTSGTAGSTPSPDLTSSSSSVSTIHKILSPVAIVILSGSVFLLRLQPVKNKLRINFPRELLYGAFAGVLLSLGCSIAGLILAFTTFIPKESSASLKQHVFDSVHARIGFAFLVALYILSLPCVFIFTAIETPRLSSSRKHERPSTRASSPRFSSSATAYPDMHTQSIEYTRERRPSTPFSWFDARLAPTSQISVESADHLSNDSPPARKGFEVMNRPKGRSIPSQATLQNRSESGRMLPRTLSDISWLDRRRSLNAIGELDYALSQMHSPTEQGIRGFDENVQGTTPLMRAQELDLTSTKPLLSSNLIYQLSYLLFHTCLLACAIITLIALWKLDTIGPFIAFLLWMVFVYMGLLTLAWFGSSSTPSPSNLLLNGRKSVASEESEKPRVVEPLLLTPVDNSPYLHVAPVRLADASHDQAQTSFHSPATNGEVDDDDDVDDDAKQQEIEREMQRREVSIITVPRRQLRIANA